MSICHPERSEGSAFALAFLAVIPSGNLLLLLQRSPTEIVPRRTISGEWEGSGEECWKWLGFSGLHLHVLYAKCALVQRMGISLN